MSEFLHMGGYAAFVWSSFGLTALILIYNAIQPMLRHKQVKRQVLGAIKRDEQKKAPKST